MQYSHGITESERYLIRLCRRSFLSLWSFPNLYTDEGKRNDGDGQELCDLLVVFGDDVIIFSDKDISFNHQIEVGIAWRRWFKRAVQKSAYQIFGAERWIKHFPSRIFLDRKCRESFPFATQNKRVHRVVVARGIYQACKRYFGDTSLGSLVVNSSLAGNGHFAHPFHIGHVAPQKGFVHVFEDFTLDAVFDELDTVADFIAYLTKRESFLTAEQPKIMAAGDEQLLSLYLTKMNDNGEHDFIWNTKRDEAPRGIFLDQTFWAGMRTNPQYMAKKRADRLSYSWDLLIEHFIKNTASDADRVYIEPAVRLMASEPRLRRRQLAPALIHIMKNTPKGKRAARVVYSNDLPDRAYVFLVVPKLDSQSYEQYREDRRNLLFAYCKVTKLRCPDANLILGIATEPRAGHGGSEDLVFLDVKDWTEERDKEAHWLRDELSLLKENVQRTESSTLEYPDVPQSEDTKATS